MPSYVITGVSRGLGWEFMNQLSAIPGNVVIGLVRDKPTTDKKVAEKLPNRPNITILQADIGDFDALKASVDATSKITGGSLDYLVANAAYVPHWDQYDPIGVLCEQPKKLEDELQALTKYNVTAAIHLIQLYMPLVLKGQAKKVIAITSAYADIEPVRLLDQPVAALYSISKAGLNMVIAKFSAQYRKDGVLFISLSPGVVEVGHHTNATPEQQQSMLALMQKFQEYAPHYKGPATPPEAIRDCINVWEKCSIENGDGGAFLSHHGDKNWL